MIDETDRIPLGNARDLTGQLFGKLKPLFRITNQGKNTRWRCECQCEAKTIVDVLAGNLTSGHTTSCGCEHRRKTSEANIDDLTGKRFGRLTVIGLAEEKWYYPDGKRTRLKWHCICDCGNECDIDGTCLRLGRTKSCGCLLKEMNSQNYTEDLTGQKFGMLTALYKIGSDSHGTSIWHCKCDCGQECDVRAGHLKRDTRSCGCLKQSYGEHHIAEILKENNIPYITEKTFQTCRFEDTGKLAKFDFWVNNKYIIEFDGQQHFRYGNSGRYDEKTYRKIVEHDNIKNQWCKDNNIQIIRIPYTIIDTITINDLIPKEE